jgi:hypothetical protein
MVSTGRALSTGAPWSAFTVLRPGGLFFVGVYGGNESAEGPIDDDEHVPGLLVADGVTACVISARVSCSGTPVNERV